MSTLSSIIFREKVQDTQNIALGNLFYPLYTDTQIKDTLKDKIAVGDEAIFLGF